MNIRQELESCQHALQLFTHLTLARVQDRAGRDARRRLGECLQHFAAPAIPAFQIDHVALVASELSPEGSRYQTQYRAPLT